MVRPWAYLPLACLCVKRKVLNLNGARGFENRRRIPSDSSIEPDLGLGHDGDRRKTVGAGRRKRLVELFIGWTNRVVNIERSVNILAGWWSIALLNIMERFCDCMMASLFNGSCDQGWIEEEMDLRYFLAQVARSREKQGSTQLSRVRLKVVRLEHFRDSINVDSATPLRLIFAYKLAAACKKVLHNMPSVIIHHSDDCSCFSIIFRRFSSSAKQLLFSS